MNRIKTVIYKHTSTLFLFVLYCVTRVLYFKHVPSSPSPEQIAFFERIHLFLPLQSSIPLLIPFLCGLLAVYLIFILAKRYTSDQTLAFWIAFMVSIAPWFFILTIHFNVYLPLVVVTLVLFLLPVSEKNQFRIAFMYALTVPYLLGRIPFAHTFFTHDSLVDLMKITDIRTLFFTGDWTSTFIRIPLTGYFMYIELISISVGLYALLSQNYKRIKILLLMILALGIGFFLAHIYNFIPSYRGIFLFIVYSMISGTGVYYVWKQKNMLFKIAVIFFLSVNMLYYGEIVLFHFDAWNSSDWTFAQSQIVTYAQGFNVKNIYLTSNSEDIHHFLNYYLQKSVTVQQKSLEHMKGLCGEPPNGNLCILSEQDLKAIGLTKEETFKQYRVVSGLPLYFSPSY